ncbi:MAG: hypothetical protein WA813_22040, partial [Beijerinckiaceae bacterium]
MWREFDRRRCVLRAAAVLALLGAPFVIASVPSMAQEGMAAGPSPSVTADLPLPPYPPQIFGFEELKNPVSVEATGSPQRPETLSSEPLPTTKLQPETKAASDEKKESSSLAGEAVSAPPPATPAGVADASEVARAAF